jgi:Domain of unknown function (DUF5666)
MALRKIVSIGTVAVVIFIANPALAESTQKNTTEQGYGPRNMMVGKMMKGKLPPMMRPAVMGSVSSISGTTITLNGRVTPGNNATTTYNIDASNAKIFKGGATSTISNIATGDMIFVEGTVNGSNVTATAIRDGVRGVGFGPGKRELEGPRNASSSTAFTGNGQPLVAGKISAVSGNTLTVTTGNNVTYTVDATNAKILKGKDPISLSGVVNGDGVLVQGAVNGNSIVAATIIDKPQSTSQNTEPAHGTFENLGGFFKHLFGF